MTERRRIRSFDWSTAVIALIAVAAVAFGYVRDGAGEVLDILETDLKLFAAILPQMLAGCLIGAFVTMLLPREVVARTVGSESGIFGLFIATGVGAILPGGPFTIYPVAGALLTLGADAGTAITFITSWTLLGYNRAIVWELPFFGTDFVLWRMLVAIPLPIVAGLLARLAVRLVQAEAAP
jgi:uncharacterized membrane protein YraQ (UPF0718 family)